MYHSILEGIFNAKNIDFADVFGKQQYLASLKNHVRSIRSAYRNFPVHFDYSNIDVQAAYLITYLPHYTDFLWKVLKNEGDVIANEKFDELMFIGSGPCPEIIGYFRYLTERRNIVQPKIINVNVFDIAVDDWKWSRDIIFKYVVPDYTDSSISLRRFANNIDISQSLNFNYNGGKVLCVFQNCLNEISERQHSTLIDNVKNLFQALPIDSYIALIDLDYREVRVLLSKIETTLQIFTNCEIVRSIDYGQVEHRTTQDNEPSIIRQYLLTDRIGNDAPATGLLPKRRLPFMYSLIKKTDQINISNQKYLFDDNYNDFELPF